LNLSYWEEKYYFEDNDLVVVGAGIVGLSTAIAAKILQPNLKILVLERSTLPSGASTKNAGFACFGSVTELLSDSAHIILYGVEVQKVESGCVAFSDKEINAPKIAICTNGLSRSLLSNISLQAVRNQVFITERLKDNPLKSCYHFDQGYIYFREIDNRILIGGTRNLHSTQETTDQFGQTDNVRSYLKAFVEDRVIGRSIQFEYEWSGIKVYYL